MTLSLVVSIVTIILIIIFSLFKSSIRIRGVNINLYWIIALIGALIILFSNSLSWNELWLGLTSDSGINPIQILILFLSMSIISIFLDELGLFAHLARWVLRKTHSSQIKVFISFYILISLLTMFTSNDIVILTLTPFLIFFTKNAKISPIPYLVMEFMAANTWSMMFLIGNPTNIYLSQSFGIAFIEYFKIMAVPTLLAGLLEILLLLVIFKKKLADKINYQDIELPEMNKFLLVIGLIILGACTILLIISSYINLPMYLIAASALGALLLVVLIYSLLTHKSPIELGHSLKRGPYELIPFILAMFTIVLSLDKYNVTSEICKFFGSSNTIYVYGYSSLLSANLINNIPMSVLYSSIISYSNNASQTGSIYSTIVGSNIGAFITPLGALAGIMWMGILKTHQIKFTFFDFIKYGLIIGLPVATVAFLALNCFIH